MSYWRQAGLNYLQYSRIAAQTLRKCLKPEFQTELMMKKESELKLTKWEGGKITTDVSKIKI